MYKEQVGQSPVIRLLLGHHLPDQQEQAAPALPQAPLLSCHCYLLLLPPFSHRPLLPLLAGQCLGWDREQSWIRPHSAYMGKTGTQLPCLSRVIHGGDDRDDTDNVDTDAAPRIVTA